MRQCNTFKVVVRETPCSASDTRNAVDDVDDDVDDDDVDDVDDKLNKGNFNVSATSACRS